MTLKCRFDKILNFVLQGRRSESFDPSSSTFLNQWRKTDAMYGIPLETQDHFRIIKPKFR